MTLQDFIIDITDCAVRNPVAYIKPGHNGPYKDVETEARNKSHWLITLIKAYDITHDTKYLNLARDLADYLISDEVRPHGFSFYHRSKDGKDKCNGLIGQAWTLEALAKASLVTENPKYTEPVSLPIIAIGFGSW